MTSSHPHRLQSSVFSPYAPPRGALPRRFIPWLILMLSAVSIYCAAYIASLVISRHRGVSLDTVMQSAEMQSLLTISAIVGIGFAAMFLISGLFGPACPRCWRHRPAFVKTFQGRVVVRCQRPDCGEIFVESMMGLMGHRLTESDLELVNHVEQPRLGASELSYEEMATPTTVGVLLKTQRNIRQTEGWVSLLSYRGNTEPSRDDERLPIADEPSVASSSVSLEKGANA